MIFQQGSPHLVIDGLEQIDLRRDYVLVGRDPTCDVWLDDPRVSRIHAALRRRGKTVWVQDLDSSCGTFVGGTAVKGARELHPGEVINFASVTARFEPPASKARWLSWTGLIVLAEGYAIVALTKLNPGTTLRGGKGGLDLAGVPTGPLGWALAGAGFALLLAGFGLHIAASRRR
jgi:FHA domain